MMKHSMLKETQTSFFGKLLVAVILAIILMSMISLRDYSQVSAPDESISVAYSWVLSQEQIPSPALVSGDISWQRMPSESIATASPYAYVRIELQNTGYHDRELIIYNTTRNELTSLLLPLASGAVVLHRHGNSIPISQSPLRHYKAAFPIIIPVGVNTVFILEYYGARGLMVSPGVLSSDLWLSQHLFERSLLTFAVGGVLALTLLNLILSVFLGARFFFSTALFLFTLCFFYLRQSRLLMLIIDPLVYPEWLFPFSIAMNCAAGLFFFSTLFPPGYSGWEKKAIYWLIGTAIGLGLGSFVLNSYLMSDVLNAFSILILPLMFYYSIKAAAGKNYGPLMVIVSFFPWMILMILDVVITQFGSRQTASADFRLWIGLVVTLIILMVTRLYLYTRSIVDESFTARAGLPSANSADNTSRYSSSSVNAVNNERYFYRFYQPLDSIIASARIMEKEYADPGIMAVAQIIIEEAERIKHAGHVVSQLPVIQDLFVNDAVPGLEKNASLHPVVYIFDYDKQQSARMANMLCAQGFSSRPVADRYKILTDVTQGLVDVLIIDAASCGEAGFTLCRFIREKTSMIQFPVLLITDFFEQTTLKRGYAVGVNDYLTRPYDGAELTARIRSLIRLRDTARMNQDLERSEKEKNTFLYFLTHNVNTPLTVLMNLVREFSTKPATTDEAEKISEMEDCVTEISDIVQNVLISFRLTDGRQTLWLEPLDLADELPRTIRDITKRAAQKKQTLSVTIDENLPAVLADRTSVRGIMYNLIDNAVKFTPPGGAVTVTVTGGTDVQVEVCDSGPGIPSEEHSRLFQRFECLSPRPTAGESSTGLGLHVSRELAVMNGGSLEYYDSKSGACFLLTLQRYYGD